MWLGAAEPLFLSQGDKNANRVPQSPPYMKNTNRFTTGSVFGFFNQVSENSTEFAINTQILCCVCVLITATPEEERQRSQFKPAPAKARAH